MSSASEITGRAPLPVLARKPKQGPKQQVHPRIVARGVAKARRNSAANFGTAQQFVTDAAGTTRARLRLSPQ
jgi:hypothetical protein